MPSENIITRANGAADFQVGEVVHVTADRLVARAQADAAANLSGALGLAVGWTVVFNGVHPVVLEAGLAPVAGQTLYVSATQPGRATNIQPALPALARGFATILDASMYSAASPIVDCAMSDAPGGVVPSGAEGFLSEVVTNDSGSPLAVGEVVRIRANDAVTLAQSNALPAVQGTIGVALQAAAFPGTVPVVTEGKAIALLEAGLLGIVAGQTLWVSPNVAGRATNVKPVAPNFALCIGVIKDATGVSSPTGLNDTAITDIDVDCEPTQSGGGGGSGLSAYGHAVGQSDNVIGANALVGYDLGATPFPNAGFTSVPAPGGGTSFVVATAGAYEYDFYVAGLPASNVPLEFVLQVNAAMQGPAHEFRSDFQATATDQRVCRGQGIILLAAGDSVAVRNRTNTVTDTVTQTSVPQGAGEAGANRTFTLKKLN